MGDKKEFFLSAKNVLQTEDGSGTCFCESGGEFVLPDYLPKIQKVLRIEARALPPSRYRNTSEAQMSGDVLHSLLYVGEDGEIGATVLPAKYEFSVPLSSEREVSSVSAAVVVDSMTYRVPGPRKVNIRTRLRAKPFVLWNEDITQQQIPSGEIQGLQTLHKEIDSLQTTVLQMTDITVSESLDLGTDARPIWCGSTAAVQDVRVMEGGVSVRGDVCMKVLLDGEKPNFLYKKVPFEAFLDGDVHKGASATAVANVLSTEVTAGKEGDAFADAVLQVEAIVDMPCKVGTVADAFCTRCAGKMEYRMLPTTRLLLARSGLYTVGGSVTKAAAGAAGLSAVVDTCGEAMVEETTLSGGKMTVQGKCSLNTVYVDGEGKMASAEYAVPFAVVLDCETPDNTVSRASVSLLTARVRPDGENLVCDMDLAVSVRAMAKGESAAVSKMDFTEAKPYAQSSYPLSLIYPNGDSLWNISKKYHAAPENLAKVNALPPEDLSRTVSKTVLILEQ